jgi:hypothetical protein
MIRVNVPVEGVQTYDVDTTPDRLPAVTKRDLLNAWDAAHEAATHAAWGTARLFRFHKPDGSTTDLALADRDACCWAGAVDSTTPMHTQYGLSLFLRLLALIDLLAHATWAQTLCVLHRQGATLDPGLVRAAASLPLTEEARFDEQHLRALLPALPHPNARELPGRLEAKS